MCHNVTSIMPECGCVWTSHVLPAALFPAQELLWHHRRRLSARAIRLGYNVMVVSHMTQAVMRVGAVILTHATLRGGGL